MMLLGCLCLLGFVLAAGAASVLIVYYAKPRPPRVLTVEEPPLDDASPVPGHDDGSLPVLPGHPGLPRLPSRPSWLGLFIDVKPSSPVAVFGVCRLSAPVELELVFVSRATNAQVTAPVQWLTPAGSVESKLDARRAVARYFVLHREALPDVGGGEQRVFARGGDLRSNEAVITFSLVSL